MLVVYLKSNAPLGWCLGDGGEVGMVRVAVMATAIEVVMRGDEDGDEGDVRGDEGGGVVAVVAVGSPEFGLKSPKNRRRGNGGLVIK
ncbi:hypothetical protein Tco_1382021 [Tanacetum coccineum]